MKYKQRPEESLKLKTFWKVLLNKLISICLIFAGDEGQKKTRYKKIKFEKNNSLKYKSQVLASSTHNTKSTENLSQDLRFVFSCFHYTRRMNYYFMNVTLQESVSVFRGEYVNNVTY